MQFATTENATCGLKRHSHIETGKLLTTVQHLSTVEHSSNAASERKVETLESDGLGGGGRF